jgi:hypothetical protein
MEIEIYAPILLLWLDEQAQQNPSRFADVTVFAAEQNIEPSFAGRLITVLEGNGLAETAGGMSGVDTPATSITDLGKAEAQRYRERRKDRVERTHYARDSLLSWLFNKNADQLAIPVSEFVTTPQSFFLGDQLSVDEVVAATRYLAEQRLIKPETTGGDVTRHPVALTADGIDCAMSESSVRNYSSRSNSTGGDTIFHIQTNTGNIAANSQGFTQNATSSSGVDTSALEAFATLVRQLAPSLSPRPDEQRELLDQVEELEGAVASEQPDRGRLRTLGNGVLTVLRRLAYSPEVQRLALEAGEGALRQSLG